MEKKRYTVFVSSTFKDLQEERESVIRAIQAGGDFPIAMEFFNASTRNPSEYIQDRLRQCDYYVVILGWKYGTRERSSDLSFTELEYIEAKKLEIPILAFTREWSSELPNGLIDQDPKDLGDLKRFRASIADLTKVNWSKKEQLASKVSSSLREETEMMPRVGWRRADQWPEEAAKAHRELSDSREQLHILRRELRGMPEPFPNFDSAAERIEERFEAAKQWSYVEGDPIKLRVFGVCFHKSFPIVSRFAREMSALGRTLEIRMAMLDPNCERFQSLNDIWKDRHERFSEALEELQKYCSDTAKSKVSLKPYCYSHMPNWHGLLINRREVFLSTCLWSKEQKLMVGQNPYDFYCDDNGDRHRSKTRFFRKWFDYVRYTYPETRNLVIKPNGEQGADDQLPARAESKAK